MNIIKKAHLVWLFSAALALSAGAFTVSGNQVDAATTQSAYTVKAGDTLSAIAAANNVTVDDLASINHIQDKHLILVGQQLQLNAEETTVQEAPATTYTVKAGDTLSTIADATKVSVTDLVSYNNLQDPNLIHVGTTLQLTGTKAASQPAAAQQQPAQQAAPAAQQQSTAQSAPVQQQAQQTTQQSTTTNQGTFKISFYDPAVLGSNMGYSGVAANLSVFPKGTRLKISASNGQVWYRTVNDTGSFAYSNPRQLDVAMPNNQIPSAGILSATVEVIN